MCTKLFAQLESLKTYLMIHSGNSPLKCHICDKSFDLYKSLKAPLLTLTDERPHNCPTCDRPLLRLKIKKKIN